MGADLMGRVIVEATVENLFDLYTVQQGLLKSSLVRRISVPDAVIDPEAIRLSLPAQAILELGLKPTTETVWERGAEKTAVYTPVHLTVQGRDCNVEVVLSADGEPTIVGRTALLLMDWVVDPRNHRLIGNPAHGGEQMIELY